jgi:hypothetical protein
MSFNLYDAVQGALTSDIIDELEPDFIEESIKAQLKNPFSSSINTNYYQIFNDKYKEYVRSSDHNDEIEEIRDTLVINIINKIKSRFKLEVCVDDQNEYKIVKHMYNFFVYEIRQNMVDFFVAYILKEKKSIINNIDRSKNNVSSMTSKSYFTKKEDGLILANIYDVYSYICQLDMPLDNVISYIQLRPDVSSSLHEIQVYLDKQIIISEKEDTFNKIVKLMEDEEANIITDISSTLYQIFDYNEVNQDDLYTKSTEGEDD